MTEPPVPPAPDDPPDGSPALSPVPFAVALVAFLVLAVLAFVFLRADDEGELVRPDRLTAIDDDTILAVALEQPGCGRVERAQVDLGEDEIHLELVVVDRDGPCSDVTVDVVAEVTIPAPIDDRRLLAGVGRLALPCEDGSIVEGAPTITCGPAG